jgi:hypothetical protein
LIRRIRVGSMVPKALIRGGLPMNVSRRRLLAVGSSTFLAGAIGSPFVARAQQAQWTYKYANNLPETHPMNVRAREMAAAI